jgi:hypothetical protein
VGGAVAVGPIVATGVGLGVRVFIAPGVVVERSTLVSSDVPDDVGDDEGSSVASVPEHAAISTETTRLRKTKQNGRSELIRTVYDKGKSIADWPMAECRNGSRPFTAVRSWNGCEDSQAR